MSGEALHAATIERYQEHVNPYLARLMNFAGFGVEVEAEGCYIFDHEGRKYLDCLGGYGVFTFGHRHPKIVQAVKDQLDRMPLSGKTFFNEAQGRLAEILGTRSPGDLKYTFFSNSGTEAVEAALKFARASTGRSRMVSTIGGYHGKTMGALSVTGREKYQKPFAPLVPEAVFVPYGDAEAAAAAINDETACFIVEPIQGEGGIHVPPSGYLKAVREACDKHGALLILDEVQTSMGRTGKLFACEHEGVVPDMITLAKSLGGGIMPIGATIGTERVWEVFADNPLLHTSTFGGNPLACSAGIAAFELLEEEDLLDRADSVGRVLKDALQEVADQHELVAEVRGLGLMLGVEFAIDEVGELVIAQMVKRGLIAAYTLNNPRVIRFEPPLIITEEEARWAAKTFGEAVAETAELLEALT